MSDDRAEDLTKSASATSGEPQPPASNQAKDEPIASAPSESPQSSGASAGGSSRTPGEQGDLPRPMQVDDVRAAANMREAATMPAHTTGGVPTPGDSKGVSVPSVQAAAGTSEESGEMGEVRVTVNAPPGKPDGEVDTRP